MCIYLGLMVTCSVFGNAEAGTFCSIPESHKIFQILVSLLMISLIDMNFSYQEQIVSCY